MERFNVFANKQGGYHTIRIPALAVTPEGAVLAFAEGRKESSADTAETDLIMRRSTDGGETWSDIRILRDKTSAHNPVPIVDRETKQVILLHIDNAHKKAFRMISGDGGRTWSEPVEITSAFQQLDYDLKRFATGPGHGIQMSTGRLVAPIHVSSLTLKQVRKVNRDLDVIRENPGAYRTGVIYSDDHGRTWQAGGLVPATIPWLNESSVFQADDGSLVMNSRAHLAGYRSRAVSRDGGQSWSEPELQKDLKDPTCHGATLKLRHGPMAGAVLLSNLDMQRDNISLRANLTIRLSHDDGENWPDKRVVESGPSGYSDLAQLPDGRVLCLFENGDEIYRERLSLARFDPAWVKGGHE